MPGSAGILIREPLGARLNMNASGIKPEERGADFLKYIYPYIFTGTVRTYPNRIRGKKTRCRERPLHRVRFISCGGIDSRCERCRLAYRSRASSPIGTQGTKQALG